MCLSLYLEDFVLVSCTSILPVNHGRSRDGRPIQRSVKIISYEVHSNKIGFLGGHYGLPDQRDPTRHPKNEVLFSKQTPNSATKRRKHLLHCLWKSRLLEKHSRTI